MLSYTFDHLPHPREFLAACHSILDPDHGLLVVEIHDLEKVVDRFEDVANRISGIVIEQV